MTELTRNLSNRLYIAALLGMGFILSSSAVTAQPMSGKAAEQAAFAMASQYVVSCNGKYYTQTEFGSIREYPEKLKLELFIPSSASRADVTEADLLNGIRWRGLAEFGLGKSGRSIDAQGAIGEWKPSYSALRFNFSFRDGSWKILDESVSSDLFGDRQTLVRGPTCETVRQRIARTK